MKLLHLKLKEEIDLRRWMIMMLAIVLCFGTMLPIAMAAPASVNASFDSHNGIVTITGNLGTSGNSIVTVQVRDPKNQIDYLDQGKSDASGAYRFVYKLNKPQQGTYSVSIKGQNTGAVSTTKFDVASVAVGLTAQLNPQQPDGQNGWYVHPVSVTITSVNALPEGYKIQYRVNQGEWAAYGEPLQVSTNGTNTVEYRTVDAGGSPGQPAAVTLNVDTTAPVTTATASPVSGQNGWYATNPTVTLAATDNVSVTKTVYRINGGQWSTYSQPVTVATYGINTFEYKSSDTAGNEEESKALTLKVDTTPPTVKVTLDKSTIWPANNKMVSVTASVYATDTLSQVDSIVLTSITSNEPLQADDIQDAQYGTYDTVFMLRAQRAGSGSGRIYTITYTVKDKAGNTTKASATVTVPHDQSGK